MSGLEHVPERNIALKIHKNLLCLICKSNGIRFDKAIEQLNLNFKIVDNVISDKIVKSFDKYEYKSKKVQSQLTNKIVYDFETFNTDTAVPYANCIYRPSKISVKYNRDTTEREYEKCGKDCFIYNGAVSFNELLDHVLQIKGETKKVNNKNVKYNLYKLALNGSGFDSYVALKNLPQWRTIVSLIKNVPGIVSLKIFAGYVDENKKVANMYNLDVVEFKKIFR